MERPFDALQELTDIVEAEPGPQVAEIPGDDGEAAARRGGARRGKPPAKGLVNCLTERSVRSSGFGLQLRRHVLVQRQRGTHIMMLMLKHHDVNPKTVAQA